MTTTYERPLATIVTEGADTQDEWIWGLVAAAVALFGGVALACRAICWGTPKSCKTTWYGALDVVCK
jgi:hypothetical protein